MTEPEPRPIAQPRTRVSLGWVAAVAIIVFLLTQLGARVLRTSWTFPSDFVAPAAFNQPFVLTGMGFDWVEGRFRSAIGDADALARRFYAFCPDVVDQGTQTVDALARELRDSQQLYCWWD